VVGHEAAGGLEDLADGHLGEDAHGQDQPAGDLEGQGAAAAVQAAGVAEHLQKLAWGDNLLQEEQAVEDALALTQRQGALPLCPGFLHPCCCLLRFLLLGLHRGLLGDLVLSKPKLPRGCDLRLRSTVLRLSTTTAPPPPRSGWVQGTMSSASAAGAWTTL